MKKLALILFFSLTVFAQERQENLYSRSLKACLEKEVEAFASFSSRDLFNVIIVKDFKLTNDLPTEFGKIKVEYVSYSELAQKFKILTKDRYKEQGKIPVIEIYPLRDKGSKLSFSYNNYWFSYAEKGGFLSPKKIFHNLSLEGGCKADIGFDSKEQKFVIEKVELWGV